MPTNLAPLWTGAFSHAEKEKVSKQVLNYINQTGIDLFPGGVPNTLTQSGEQWDYPNVWPPMQYLLVEGLRALGTPEACKMSFEWASRWVRSNFIAYKQTRAMFEKVCNEFNRFSTINEILESKFNLAISILTYKMCLIFILSPSV